jgi:hypothetical protein
VCEHNSAKRLYSYCGERDGSLRGRLEGRRQNPNFFCIKRIHSGAARKGWPPASFADSRGLPMRFQRSPVNYSQPLLVAMPSELCHAQKRKYLEE